MPSNDSHIAELLAGLSVVDLRVQWAVVRARANGLRPDDEFRGLYLSDELIDQLLQYQIGQHRWTKHQTHSQNWPSKIQEAWSTWRKQTVYQPNCVHSRISFLIQEFALTAEESELFLLALAPEIDPRYGQIFAYLQDDVMCKKPSVDLLLNLLTDDTEKKLNLRRLLGNNGRLIHNRLLFRSEQGEKDFLSQTVRPYPHIVEYLVNDDQLSPELATIAKLVHIPPSWKPKRITSTRLAELNRLNQTEEKQARPIFVFSGSKGNGRSEAAWYVAHLHNQPLMTVNAADLQAHPAKNRELFVSLLRDGRLYRAPLYFVNWEAIHEEVMASPDLFGMLLDYPQVVMISSEKTGQPFFVTGERAVYTISFTMPDFGDRLALWSTHLGSETGLDLTAVATYFRFSAGQIEGAIKTAGDLARARNEPLANEDLFDASRKHSNQNLAVLATKIEPRYTWQDIVLPADTLNQLHEIVNTVRYRPQVYDRWGFEKKMALGKGVSALFAGDSGTGKTMAADIIARELSLDLYKVDISSLVSKYIGETEKNLDRIFTEAASSNAILFFDEADAIFGKRSQVKDSHDRYANIEISYLLQRMETYDGVVILATNLRSNLDEAFTRRLHFAIEFPFPDVADRVYIWQVNFPPETPQTNDIDFDLLAQRYPLAGGNIRNIILAAAFLAAKESSPVGMAHLLHGTKREYQKIGRLIDEGLFAL